MTVRQKERKKVSNLRGPQCTLSAHTKRIVDFAGSQCLLDSALSKFRRTFASCVIVASKKAQVLVTRHMGPLSGLVLAVLMIMEQELIISDCVSDVVTSKSGGVFVALRLALCRPLRGQLHSALRDAGLSNSKCPVPS